MPEKGDAFTLYLRGGDGAALRKVLKPFGDGGDLERWTLEAWEAEVILGKAAEVALIRVPQTMDAGSVRTLITELHAAAKEAGLVLSDDVTSRKSPEQLMQAFGLESERADALRAGKPSARWSLNKTLAFWAVALVMVALAYVAFEYLSAAAHAALEGR